MSLAGLHTFLNLPQKQKKKKNYSRCDALWCLHCSMWETSRAALLSLQVRLPLDKSCLICKAKRYLCTHKTVWVHLLWHFTYITSMLRLYLVRPLLSCPGSGGKNLTINLKNKSLVSDRGEKKRDYRRRTMVPTETLRSGNIWRKYEVRALILGQIWLTFDLFDQRFQQLQPNLQQKLVKTLKTSRTDLCVSVWSSISYIIATVVSELQAKVLLLQQFQMTAHFVVEVAT